MTEIPVHLRSDHGVPFAPVAFFPAAGLRCFFAGPHHSLLAFIPWALLLRIAVATVSFSGGLLIAQLLAADIAADARACGPCALQSSLVPFAMGCALPLLPLLVKRLRKRLARAFGLAGGVLSQPVSAAEPPCLTKAHTHGEPS